MPNFRKKPIVVEAERCSERMSIETLEGTMVAEPGDWIITGIKGERYPCKPDIFEATYERAESSRTWFRSTELELMANKIGEMRRADVS